MQPTARSSPLRTAFPLFSSDIPLPGHLSAHLLVTRTDYRPNLTYSGGFPGLLTLGRPSLPLFSFQTSTGFLPGRRNLHLRLAKVNATSRESRAILHDFPDRRSEAQIVAT